MTAATMNGPSTSRASQRRIAAATRSQTNRPRFDSPRAVEPAGPTGSVEAGAATTSGSVPAASVASGASTRSADRSSTFALLGEAGHADARKKAAVRRDRVGSSVARRPIADPFAEWDEGREIGLDRPTIVDLDRDRRLDLEDSEVARAGPLDRTSRAIADEGSRSVRME